MKSMLKQVQLEALSKSAGKPGFAYFLEMGLGKTLLAATDFLERVAEGNSQISVVICPNSFKSGWKAEIEKHKLNIDPCVFESGSENHLYWNRRAATKPRMLIVNYEAIRSVKTQQFIREFVFNKQGFLILDESIQIKTYNSQQTKAALDLSKYFKWVRILSGKPITSGPHDLWAQLRAIRVLEGWNYFHFRGKFCKMGGWQGKHVIGSKNEGMLQRVIAPNVFWATKANWTDLPPKLFTERYYTLPPEVKRHYDSMEHDFMVWLDSGETVTVEAAITKYIKMAQVQSGFIIKEDGSVQELVPISNNTRLAALLECIETEVTGKVIIPYFHKYAGKLLWDALCAKGWNPAAITGGMRPEEIEAMKHKFNTQKNCKVIVIQIRAGKYGHTLLGLDEPEHHCSTTVFFENTYSLDDRSQVEDRNHRYGQIGDSVLYVDFVGTALDGRVIKALQNKENIFQTVFAPLRTSKATPQPAEVQPQEGVPAAS